MAMYIRTKYGDDAAQEWTSKKRIVLVETTYSSAIETKHAERVPQPESNSIEKLPVSWLSRMILKRRLQLSPTTKTS
jgi:hypothetical protein